MNINLPSKVRAALYILVVLGSPVVGYLSVTEVLGTAEVALWSALTTAIAGLAALNVTPDSEN
jgi:hypothetical protein